VLNPALVIVEVAINLYALYWNRHNAGRVIRRVIPLALGLVPGVIAGALLLGHVAPTDMKLIVFSVLLPLILLQASGRRWPIRRSGRVSVNGKSRTGRPPRSRPPARPMRRQPAWSTSATERRCDCLRRPTRQR